MRVERLAPSGEVHLSQRVSTILHVSIATVAPRRPVDRRHIYGFVVKRVDVRRIGMGVTEISISMCLYKLSELEIVVHPPHEALPVAVAVHTPLVVVAYRHFVLAGSSTGDEAQRVSLTGGMSFEQHFRPVGVWICIRILSIQLRVVINEILRVSLIPSTGRVVVVFQLIDHLHVIDSSCIFCNSRRAVGTNLHIIGKVELSSLGPFGGDEHNPGSSSRPVDSRRGSVL